MKVLGIVWIAARPGESLSAYWLRCAAVAASAAGFSGVPLLFLLWPPSSPENAPAILLAVIPFGMATVGCLWYLFDAWRAARLRITITQGQANDPLFDADGLFRLAKYRRQRDKERHLPPIVRTRRALWKQLLPGALGVLMAFFLLLGGLKHENIMKVDFLWLLWLASCLLLLMLWVVYFARRALWLCVFRSASLAAFMGTFAIAGSLPAMNAMTFGLRVETIFAAMAYLAACAVLFHLKRTVPYWELTLPQNTMHKINLHTGVFSVGADWAPFPGEARISRWQIFGYVAPIGSLLGLWASRALSGTPLMVEFIGVLGFLLFGLDGLSGSKAYF